MSTTSPKAFHVFISHSSQDAQWAQRVCECLELRGLKCWIAPRDIVPGSEWGAAIIDGIDRSRVVVLIFSNMANESAQVRREVERAISKSIPVLPMRIEDIRPQGALEFALGNTHWLDAFASPIEDRMQQLAAAVEALLGIESRDSTTTAATSKSDKPATSKSVTSPALPAPASAPSAVPRAATATGTSTASNKQPRRSFSKWIALSAIVFFGLCVPPIVYMFGSDQEGSDDGGEGEVKIEAVDKDLTQQFEGFWRAEAESLNGRVFDADHVQGRNLTLAIRDHSVVHRRQPTADSTLVINGSIELGLVNGKPSFSLRGKDADGVAHVWLGMYQSTDDSLELCFREARGNNGKPVRLRDMPKRPEQMFTKGERDTHYIKFQKAVRKMKANK